MASPSNDTEIILQICFGVFSIFGIIITLAGLHYRDSLGCVLFRRRYDNTGSSYHDLPSRTSTSPRPSETDVELALTLPPSEITPAIRAQSVGVQVQGPERASTVVHNSTASSQRQECTTPTVETPTVERLPANSLQGQPYVTSTPVQNPTIYSTIPGPVYSALPNLSALPFKQLPSQSPVTTTTILNNDAGVSGDQKAL